VRRLGSASEAEIAGLPGSGPRVASTVLAALRPGPPTEPAAEQTGDGNSAQDGIDRGEQDGHDHGQGDSQEHDQGAEGGRHEAHS
jgi:hypothetical protein